MALYLFLLPLLLCRAARLNSDDAYNVLESQQNSEKQQQQQQQKQAKQHEQELSIHDPQTVQRSIYPAWLVDDITSGNDFATAGDVVDDTQVEIPNSDDVKEFVDSSEGLIRTYLKGAHKKLLQRNMELWGDSLGDIITVLEEQELKKVLTGIPGVKDAEDLFKVSGEAKKAVSDFKAAVKDFHVGAKSGGVATGRSHLWALLSHIDKIVLTAGKYSEDEVTKPILAGAGALKKFIDFVHDVNIGKTLLKHQKELSQALASLRKAETTEDQVEAMAEATQTLEEMFKAVAGVLPFGSPYLPELKRSAKVAASVTNLMKIKVQNKQPHFFIGLEDVTEDFSAIRSQDLAYWDKTHLDHILDAADQVYHDTK